ncbi:MULTISPECIES: DUF2264 domain-containing protein [unclassified Arthrobacter]|uniref:DUF2264 domain-containing protein n=1 Tax=unclassified Arthrobacter TaxID=235627 RepID=UPI001C850292|nr:DUF2264 domain-containing protein [Arthrobacter sp. MAHUQ-56]MBX7444596.1 DUF2264 domain-containing protein [Arthrobacter sp. MAHUQ-56]
MPSTAPPLALSLPPLDRDLSPYTGLTREHWCAYADYMLRSAHRHATDDHANLHLPGATSAYGRRSDSLEAFARTFLLASFRIAGDPEQTGWIADWYAQGLDAGTDPHNPDRWPTPGELDQAKVEAASLAVGLALTREVLWDKLPQRVQEQLVTWFATVIGEKYPPINWVWFQIVVEIFLASVGGGYSDEDIDAGLAIHDALYRGHGWFADGSERAYDHYVGWAFQVYPQLLQLMAPDDPRVRARTKVDGDRLADFLDDAVHLVGSNGAPLIQGRSLIYRFAAAAPFWAGQVPGHTRLTPGVSRRAASGILKYFMDRGALNDDGLLTIGFHGEFPGMKQSYSGAGSPYWAAKGMMGLALPAEHPAWTSVEEPLPVELTDTRHLISAPGWQVDGTVADGIVRVRNHGTDHANPGVRVADSPLYARLGYSTATFPDLKAESLDNAVVFVDGAARLTHRTGFEFLRHFERDGVQVGASRATTNWIEVDPDGGPDHGSGAAGTATPGPEATVVSLTHGAVELRLVRVRGASGSDVRLRIGGWPVDPSSEVLSDVRPIASGGQCGDAGTWCQDAPHPMGNHLIIPWIGTSGPARDGDYVALVGLGGEGLRLEMDGAGFTDAGTFEFADGTAVDVDSVWAALTPGS